MLLSSRYYYNSFQIVMGEIFLIGSWISLLVVCANGIRGPHHPKSTVSHHHYIPQNEVKLTQDSELLHDAT